MDQRRSNRWLWVVGIVVLLLIVGAVAFYLGTLNGQPVAFRPRMFVVRHPFIGGIGFWLIVLVVAIGIGVLVAAIWPSSRRTETFEEWHQRQHALPRPAAPPAARPVEAPVAPPAETDPSPTPPDAGTAGG